MRLKGDSGTTRALNRRLILDRLRRNGPMSRAAITAAVGLSPAAITFVTAELIEEGLLAEGEAGPATGGRRPMPLHIVYEARLAIGFKVMADRVLGVLTDLATEVLAEIELPLPDHRPETVIETAATAAAQLMRSPRADSRRLIGIGVALPGLIDAETGLCRALHRFGWTDVPVAELLAAKVAAPVWVDNDVNAFAIAQHLFGYGRDLRTIAAVAVGRGVGAGLVVDGRLYRGRGGGAGEIGHDLSEPGGRPCECGRTGCLETYCSEAAMVRIWHERDPGRSDAGAEAMAAAAEAGDPVVLQILRESGLRLGRHIATLANLFAPEMIVIGGEAVRFGQHLFGPVRSVLKELCFAGEPPMVVDWQDNAWARGASALAIQHFFNFEATPGHRAAAWTA